ncbi:hypothetical protein V2I01_24920 [Micromonospora sp. BRA006-A]|nr:hypothetical protein [Micromonospora sp. BRA006-A]
MRNWHGEGIWYGADYNPEQWPEQTWAEDVDLHATRRGQPGLGRHLLLGPDRTQPRADVLTGWTGRSTCCTMAAPARPGHRHGQPAAVAGAPAPGDAAPPGRRHGAWPGGRQA